jgi:N-acetyl-gamma-glutamyl-phosphate reductase
MTTKPKVFIDGEAGTTGLQIRDRLSQLPAIEVVSIDPAHRKDTNARKDCMAAADLIVLCLPDDAAKEAVALADQLGEQSPRIVDASTAYRIADGWTYGFAELNAAQTAAIQTSRRVANPGCYPTGAIALLRPLIDAGLIPADHPIAVNAVSGYSGGGNAMIAAYEIAKTAPPFELYGLSLEHKHVPEVQHYAGLKRRPIFVPSVGNFRQGMLVSIPLHLATLPTKPKTLDLQNALIQHYKSAKNVAVITDAETLKSGRITPEPLNGSDRLELFVYGNDTLDQAVLVARLDNLGKGAAGAAVQNLQLMLALI